MTLLKNGGKNRILIAFSITFCTAGIVYMISKIVNPEIGYVDFRYVWMAGKLWGQGISPYSEKFILLARDIISDVTKLENWLYPPTWFFISWPLSLLPLDSAVFAWKIINSAFLCTGAFFISKTLIEGDSKEEKVLWLSFCIGFISLMQASAIVLSIGQTTPVVFLGMSLLAYGVFNDNRYVKTAGLVLVALKPQIGFYFFIASFICSRMRRDAIIAVLISLFLLIPSFISIGVTNTFVGFLNNLTSFSNLLVNDIVELSGLRNIVYFLSGIELLSSHFILLGLITMILGLFIGKRKGVLDETYSIGLAGISVLLFISLHSYDFIIAFALFPFLWRNRNFRFRIATFIIFIFLLRVDNLSEIIGLNYDRVLYSIGSIGGSICFVFMSVLFLISYWKTERD